MALPLDREPRTKAEALEVIEDLERRALDAAAEGRVQTSAGTGLYLVLPSAQERARMLRAEADRIRRAMAHLPD